MRAYYQTRMIRQPLLYLLVNFVYVSQWMRFIALSLCVSTLVLSNPCYSGQANMLILGDSLSASYGIKKKEGWVTLLEQKLTAEGYNYHVINASISGETTEGGLARLPTLLTEHKPSLLIIELGANDGLRGFPVKIINSNLSAMVKLAKEQHAQILLIGIQLPFNYGPRYTHLFEKTFVNISQTFHITLAPSLLGKVPLDERLMQEDKLHPNAKAQPQLLDHVWPYLQPLLTKASLTQ